MIFALKREKNLLNRVQRLSRFSMTQNQWLILLTVITLLATSILRFRELDRMLIWHDEVYSISRMFGIQHQQLADAVHDGKIHTPSELLRLQNPQQDGSFEKTLHSLQEHPEHGPLYYLLGWAVSDWTDKPIVALRGTSAVLSLLLFPAIFWLARELGDRRYAWLAMAFAGASPLYFLYAREARQYALWFALITAASAALLRLLRRASTTSYLSYIGLLTMALYTHLLTGLVMLAHALVVILRFYHHPSELTRLGKQLTLAWACALFFFIPWLMIIYKHAGQFQSFTGWMAQPISLSKLATAWLGHIAHLFVDLPGTQSFWILGGILALIVALQYFRHAPHQPRLFIGALIVTYLSFVVLPDLLLGGRRSVETRYLLPLLLAVELMFAWALACGLYSNKSIIRKTSFATYILILGIGLTSQYVITSADNWWTKSFSAENASFARLVNAAEKPLIIGSYTDVSTGEILSLAHLLDANVRVLMENPHKPAEIPTGYSRLFALSPYGQLRAQLEKNYKIEPFPGSWKWFIATPRN
jgi:uncharacterized membrane protein